MPELKRGELGIVVRPAAGIFHAPLAERLQCWLSLLPMYGLEAVRIEACVLEEDLRPVQEVPVVKRPEPGP